MLIYTLSLGANPEFSHTHNPRKSIVPKMLSITDVCQLIKGQRGEEIARKVSSRAGLDPWASSVLSTPQEQLPPRAASSSTTNRCSAATAEDTSGMRQPSPQINEMVTALGRGLAGGPWMGTHQRHLHQPTLPGRETARSPLLKGRAQRGAGRLQNHTTISRPLGGTSRDFTIHLLPACPQLKIPGVYNTNAPPSLNAQAGQRREDS